MEPAFYISPLSQKQIFREGGTRRIQNRWGISSILSQALGRCRQLMKIKGFHFK